METVYLVCAAVGGTVIVCQFLMALFGLGADHDAAGHDAGAGHDVDGMHEVGHGAEPAWYFSVLTLRTLTAATAFFGLAGLAGQGAALEPIPTLGISLGAGLAALFIVAWIMRMLTRLNLDGTVRIERSIGARGTVYVPIPGERTGAGKVLVSVSNRTIEFKAITSQLPLATGAKIIVVGVVGPDTVEVAPATESQGNNHG